jgi:hypothetical protein
MRAVLLPALVAGRRVTRGPEAGPAADAAFTLPEEAIERDDSSHTDRWKRSVERLGISELVLHDDVYSPKTFPATRRSIGVHDGPNGVSGPVPDCDLCAIGSRSASHLKLDAREMENFKSTGSIERPRSLRFTTAWIYFLSMALVFGMFYAVFDWGCGWRWWERVTMQTVLKRRCGLVLVVAVCLANTIEELITAPMNHIGYGSVLGLYSGAVATVQIISLMDRDSEAILGFHIKSELRAVVRLIGNLVGTVLAYLLWETSVFTLDDPGRIPAYTALTWCIFTLCNISVNIYVPYAFIEIMKTCAFCDVAVLARVALTPDSSFATRRKFVAAQGCSVAMGTLLVEASARILRPSLEKEPTPPPTAPRGAGGGARSRTPSFSEAFPHYRDPISAGRDIGTGGSDFGSLRSGVNTFADKVSCSQHCCF